LGESSRGISATVLAATLHCQRPNHEPGGISFFVDKKPTSSNIFSVLSSKQKVVGLGSNNLQAV
jgi:hypothetical protein